MSALPPPSRSRSPSSTPPASPLRAPMRYPPVDYDAPADPRIRRCIDAHPQPAGLVAEHDAGFAHRLALEGHTAARAAGFRKGAASSDMWPNVRPRFTARDADAGPPTAMHTALHCSSTVACLPASAGAYGCAPAHTPLRMYNDPHACSSFAPGTLPVTSQFITHSSSAAGSPMHAAVYCNSDGACCSSASGAYGCGSTHAPLSMCNDLRACGLFAPSTLPIAPHLVAQSSPAYGVLSMSAVHCDSDDACLPSASGTYSCAPAHAPFGVCNACASSAPFAPPATLTSSGPFPLSIPAPTASASGIAGCGLRTNSAVWDVCGPHMPVALAVPWCQASSHPSSLPSAGGVRPAGVRAHRTGVGDRRQRSAVPLRSRPPAPSAVVVCAPSLGEEAERDTSSTHILPCTPRASSSLSLASIAALRRARPTAPACAAPPPPPTVGATAQCARPSSMSLVQLRDARAAAARARTAVNTLDASAVEAISNGPP